jgi:hypothetical protein
MTQTHDSSKLRFIHHTGRFVDLTGLIDICGEDAVKEANTPLLTSFGCATDEMIDQGWDFLKSISLASTFNSWSNDDEGSSGISSKALVAGADSPGAVLTLVGLLRRHPDAKASGSLSINYSNPTRGNAGGRAR